MERTHGTACAPPALEVRHLSKSFGSNFALAGFDLDIESGQVHVLVGANGSGKSTLIKVLSGFHEPDPGGSIRVDGQRLAFGSPESAYDLGCRFVHQDLGLVANQSVADNLRLGTGFPTRLGTVRRGTLLRDTKEALASVDLDIDPRRKLGDLPASVRTGVAIARALQVQDGRAPRVIVLDEPTATLPADEVEHLLRMLRSARARGVAILFVTHHLDEVFQIADVVSVLRDGGLVGRSPIGEIDRAALVELLAGAQPDDLEPPHGRVASGPPRLEVGRLVHPPLDGISFSAFPGEIVGIAGLAGSGRESVLGAVFGATSRLAGVVSVSGTVLEPNRPDRAKAARVAYVSPDRKVSGGMMNLSARDNVGITDLRPFWSGFRLLRSRETRETQRWFDTLGVRPRGAVAQRLGAFSGGNQQKILLAKWLRCEPELILLDDPTQGVDIGAKTEIHRQLLAAAADGTTVVVSSTDIEELAAICSRVLVVRRGRVVVELAGVEVTESRITREVLTDASAQEEGLVS